MSQFVDFQVRGSDSNPDNTDDLPECLYEDETDLASVNYWFAGFYFLIMASVIYWGS